MAAVDFQGSPVAVAVGNGSWQQLVALFPPNECRLALFSLTNKNRAKKLVYLCWAPSEAPVRDRTVSASTAGGFLRALFRNAPLPYQAQASCDAELNDIYERYTSVV